MVNFTVYFEIRISAARIRKFRRVLTDNVSIAFDNEPVVPRDYESSGLRVTRHRRILSIDKSTTTTHHYAILLLILIYHI